MLNEVELFRSIGAISRRATSSINQIVGCYRLDNNLFLYLLRIIENEGMTQFDLVQKTQIDKTTLSRALVKLEKMGYISRISNDKNRNFKQLYATEKAKELSPILSDLERQYATNAFKDLTHDELISLATILAKIK